MGGSGVHGITKFADLSMIEFKRDYLGFKLNGASDSGDYDAYYDYKASIQADGINGDTFAPPLSESPIAVSNWLVCYYL